MSATNCNSKNDNNNDINMNKSKKKNNVIVWRQYDKIATMWLYRKLASSCNAMLLRQTSISCLHSSMPLIRM